MRKKERFIILMLVLGIIITGCKDKENEKKDNPEIQSVPSALEQVQQQSDEIVKLTMSEDWAGSLEKVKELQSTWNDLYPDIQKQGAKQEDVDGFVAGLNTLTDKLISKTLNLPQKPAEEEKKDEQSPEQEQKSEQGSEAGDKEEKSGEQESQGQEQEQDAESQGAEEEKKDPEKILNEIDPIISVSQEDLVIINSAVEVTKFIPKFMSLFESPVPSDIFKFKYFVYHLYVASKLGNWDIVFTDFKSVRDTWESIQPKASEVDPDLRIKLAQSIDELEDVINSKNANLTGIKCNFIIEQIESLAKTIKEKEEAKKEE